MAGAGLRITVVGGGVSGVAAAHDLSRAGCSVELIERDRRLGGRCMDGALGERRVTLGGKNIGHTYSLFRAFAGELGHRSFEPFGINSSRVVNGRVLTVESRRRVRSVAAFARLGNPRDLARLARLAVEVKRDERNRYLGSALSARLGERHDRAPLAAHFGERLTTTVLRPVTVRTIGAEPNEAFLGNLPASLAMLLDSYEQPIGGMQPLFERFGERIETLCDTTVVGLARQGGEATGVLVRDRSGGGGVRVADAIVLATPASVTAELVRPHAPALARRLDDVRYFPAATVIARYERPVFTHARRAMVFDDGPLTNAGAYGIDDLATVRYTFSGRAARPLIDSGPQELIEHGEERLGRYFPGATASRRRDLAWRAWKRAYCAFVPYHARFLADLERLARPLPRVYLTGDYLRGASIEGCFRAARACSEALLRDAPTRAA